MTGPLAGRTVLLTRTGGLEEEIRARGADVRVLPVTRYEAVDAAADPESCDRVVFTSARAVAHCPFSVALAPRIACIGPQTADVVREAGGTVDLVPDEHNAVALAAALVADGVGPGTRVLFPCADIALATLEDRLGSAGAEVTRLVVYRTVPVGSIPADAAAGVDVIVFLSPSAVNAFAELGGDLAAAPSLAIGRTTAAALAAHGVTAEVAPTSDRAGVLALLCEREWR
ncbi:MAG: uroporphyrinogen-III synthase [Planctomycetota bacterium]